MPANDRVGLHDNENFFPTRPEPKERDPEGTIKRRKSGLRSRLRIGCELLAQSKLDDRLLISTSEEGKCAAEKCSRETEQGSHRGWILRDLSAETQTDSLPDGGVT
jgi:hypothetical protein